MQIPAELLEKWKALRSPMDTAKIAELADKTPEGIAYIIKQGKCSDEVFKIIAEFYEQKADLLKQYL